MSLTATSKHFIFCLVLILWVLFFTSFTGALRLNDTILDFIDPWKEYGSILTTFIVILRLLSFLALPQTLFNVCGLLSFNAFEDKVSLKSSPLLAPFVCVRVVTRGLYPNLVRETVKKNTETLAKVGLENYVIQIATDVALNIGGE